MFRLLFSYVAAIPLLLRFYFSKLCGNVLLVSSVSFPFQVFVWCIVGLWHRNTHWNEWLSKSENQ